MSALKKTAPAPISAPRHSSLALSVQYRCASAATCPKRSAVRSVMQAVTDELAGEVTAAEVNVRYVSAAESQRLNAEYRGKNKPANVLSFDYRAANGIKAANADAPAGNIFGDIVICGEVVEAEAAEFGIPPRARHLHLLAHGALHLAGYRHDTPANANAMEALEIKILNRLGIANPYQ